MLKKFLAALAAVSTITIACTLNWSCSINVGSKITPPEHRNGWSPAAAKAAAPIRSKMPRFGIRGAPQDNARANVRLWDAAIKVTGKHLPNYPQQIGDCTSFGAKNAVEYLMCVQAARGPPGEEFHPIYPPYFYGISRVQIGKRQLGRGDGSSGAWIAQGAIDYGVLRADLAGVPSYSGSVAKEWGWQGPPQQWIDEAKQFPVRTVAPVSSPDEARDAICNGYPVTIASDCGFLMQPPTVDGRLVNRRSGTWNHQMCLIGYDGATGREPYWYVINSWGDSAHGTPPDGAPPGGFWIRAKDLAYILRQGDSFAWSNFAGFPSQDLNFRILGQKQPKTQFDKGANHAEPLTAGRRLRDGNRLRLAL